MDKPKALVVDLNNIWNKYLFARRGNFSDAMGAVLSLFKSIHKAQEFQKVVIIVDGKPVERYNEFKEYKKNRSSNPDKYIPMKTLVSVLSQYFLVLGGKYVEGDDVIAFVAQKLSNTYDTYIYSNDKDFIQLMNKGINIVYTFKRGKIDTTLSISEALSKFKNSKGEALEGIHNVIKYRTFKGDSSDGIPSACKGLLDKHIRNVVYNYWKEDTLDEDILMMVIGRCDDTKVKSALVLNKDNILRNYKLMDLCHIEDVFKKNIQKLRYKRDTESLTKYNIKPELYYW